MKRLILIILMFLLFLPIGCNNPHEGFKDDDRLKVVTSFYIMYDFTYKIAKDKVQIINLVDSSSDAHDFEFTSKDIILLENADILFYNGLGFEPWIDDIKESLTNKNLKMVNTSEKITPLEGDPHSWLSVINAISQIEVIKDTLIKYDEDNKDFYNENFNSVLNTLNNLHEDYVTTISSFTKKDIVVSHEAFGYLCHEYGLNQIGIYDIYNSDEPDIKRITEIIDFINENKITTIFYEPNINKEKVEFIANQTKTNIAILNPIEGLTKKEIKDNEDYISIMQKNLIALEGALK